jgi:DNA-binding XRE family transcriptional regulator
MPAAVAASEMAQFNAPPQPWTTVLDGPRLRAARQRQGLSQEQLAYAAGVSPATVVRLEGQRRPRCRGRTLGRLAAALGEHPAAIAPVLGPAPEPGPPRAAQPASAAEDLAACMIMCARLEAEFDTRHVRVERSRFRGSPRFVATARELGGRPYAIVTANPAEVRAELSAARDATARELGTRPHAIVTADRRRCGLS